MVAALPIANEIKYLFSRGKAKKWERRIADYVIAVQGTARLDRLDQLCTHLEVEWLWWIGHTEQSVRAAMCAPGFGGKLHPESLQIIDGLYQTIARALLDDGDIVTYLLMGHRATAREYIDAAPGGTDLRVNLAMRARLHFGNAVTRVAGESLEMSMRFALLLLDVWQRQHPTDTVVLMPRSGQQPGHPTAKDKEHGAHAMLYLLEIMASSFEGPEPIKRWIENIVGAAERSAAARDVLQSLMEALTLFTGTPVMETLDRHAHLGATFDQPRTPDGLYQMVSEDDAEARFRDAMLRPRVLLPPPHDAQLARWVARHLAEERGVAESGERVLDWFAIHRDTIARVHAENVSAIQTRPRYALRPNGIDHVDIRITPLRNVGIRTIAFHAEGYEFPDTAIHVVRRVATPHLWVTRMELTGMRLLENPDVFGHKAHARRRELLAQLLEFVVVDILARIVVDERKLHIRSSSPRRSDGLEGGAAVDSEQPRRRAHFRRLPEGQRASEESMERAMQTMRWLPQGHTFVRAVYRSGELVHDMLAEPFAVYREDDLFDLGGDS